MRRFPWTTLLLLCLLAPLRAQHYMFRHLEMRDGLSNNQVNVIHQDRDGFLWFGTASGLNRYDGYALKVYRSVPADTASLPDNFIADIQEDADGCLWIRTGGGYVLYRPDTDAFDRRIEARLWAMGISGVPTEVYVDSARVLWIYLADAHRLYRYAPGDAAATLSAGATEALRGAGGLRFAECAEGLLLADDRGAVHCLDRRSLELKWTEPGLARLLADDDRRYDVTPYADRRGRLWLCCTAGMGRYDLKSRTWEVLRRCDGPSEVCRAVTEDKDGRIWIGKDQDGIEILGPAGTEPVCLDSRADNEHSLSSNTVTTFYEDPAGTMWVGTYKGGVSYYNESMFKFGGAALGDIHCVEDGGNGVLWLGTNGAGLIRWDRQTGRRQVFAHRPGDPGSLSSDVVVTLLRDSRGRLWAGTYYGGLSCYDGRRFVNYLPRDGQPGSLPDADVWALAEDRDGYIWVGTLNHGLQCLDPRTGVFTSYDSARSGLSSDCVVSLCLSRDGRRLWVGTVSGVFVMDVQTRVLSRFASARSGRTYFDYDGVMQLCEDSRGRLWVATRAGLYVYDPSSDSVCEVPLSDDGSRLPVTGLVEDDRQEMWASVGGRLLNIVATADPRTGRLAFSRHTYSDKDGLQGGDFNQRALKRLATGELVAGGLYGVNYFHPGNIRYNRVPPRVLFTGLQLFNEPVRVGVPVQGRVVLDKALNRSREVVLDYKQNVFTVFLATDNYVLPEKTRYCYKLEGFNEDWLSETGNQHRVTYTNLAPGTYWLRVKAANSDGMGYGHEARLKIVIRPPFWLTPWAYIAYALLLGGVLLLAYRQVKRRERNKYRIRQMEEDARRNEELNQMKFRFFTNVSHELRTPLTLIISPLESLIQHTGDAATAQKLQMIYRNAQRLLNLVNQLLDFRKNEMAGARLSLSEGDVVPFVQNICNSFLMLSEKKGVRFTFASSRPSLGMAFDADKLGKVVMNLLSNAFKFTPDGGSVSVALDVPDRQPEVLEIRVADTGIGISDADKARIFERFYQAGPGHASPLSTGSGIGLSLVRDFVALHGGTVRVADNPGGGSVFVVDIPLRHTALAASPAAAVPAAVAVPAEAQPAASGPASPGASPPATAPSQAPLPPSAARGKEEKPLVLVVDDSRDFTDFMQDALSLYFRVQVASNGQDALDFIHRQKPDLILCDWMMPVMDGCELCRRVKADKQTAGIPFVLLTAKQSVETKVEGLTVGADDYVTKPFNLEVLTLRIRKLIELSRKSKPRGLIDPTPEEIVVTPLDEKLIADAIRYVEKNIARSDLSVEELSRELGMSRAHFYKKVLQITGKTPIEFIRVIRLKRAAQLLRESQQNVSEIAYQLGFNNPKYFSRYFKEEFGMLPSVYQEKEGR